MENLSVISKLKAAGNRAGSLSARLFFERFFAPADFHPPGISRRAIICVKKMTAPALKSFGQTADIRLAIEWEAGIRGAVEKMFRRAYRPFREFVPAGAECVIFVDKTEMLACLARDWLRGVLVENWWWRGLFPKLFRGQTVAEIWLEQAETAPAVFQLLAKSAAAKDFVKKLDASETVKLLREIIHLFGLRELETALFEPVAEEFLMTELQKAVAKIEFPATGKPEIFTKTGAFFGGFPADLKAPDSGFYEQTLLAVGLTLARSPRLARSPEFAALVKIERLRREFSEKVSDQKIIEFFEKLRPPGKVRKPRALPIRDFRKKVEIQKNSPTPVETIISEKGEIPGFNEEKSEKIERRPTEKQEAGKPKKTAEIKFEAFEPEKKVEKTARKIEREGGKIVEVKPEKYPFEEFFEDFERENEYRFETRFGGVFYLLNLGLFLGLYRDFTEPLESETGLNIWDFAALLAFEFLGEKIKTDELWNFLRRAAERENDRDFGDEFNQFQDWRMPTGWLETFPKNGEWIFRKISNRLVLHHSAGFNVLDINLRGETQTRLKSESEIYTGCFSQIKKAEKSDFAQIKPKTWVKNLAEFLEKRLFQALKLETREQLNAVLFERRATVSVSATHLEITFGLADLPYEIRAAGIDRDPGWIPAAGKYVYFHFV